MTIRGTIIRTVAGFLALVALYTVPAQQLRDDFGSMRSWIPAEGDWVVRGGYLAQLDRTSALARIDRALPHTDRFELEFAVQYRDGGQSDQDGYHAGFGIHIGAEDPAWGRPSWGAGQSYLLWLNIDTRSTTAIRHPEHFGLRAQLYRSDTNSRMNLVRDDSLVSNPALAGLLVDNFASVDLLAALNAWGPEIALEDLSVYLEQDIVINVTIDTRTGMIGVLDPTTPVRYVFYVDPSILQGDTISLRTNRLAARFDYLNVAPR